MIFISSLGFKKGDPKLIASPFDYKGKHCGHSAGYTEYNKIFFPKIIQIDKFQMDKFICVKKCPGKVTTKDTIECHPDDKPLIASVDDPIYETHKLAFVCIPDSTDIWKQIKSAVKIGHLQEQFHDLQICWPIYLACLGIGFVLGYIFLFLLRYCAGLIVWTLILCYFIALIVLGWICYDKSSAKKYKAEADKEDGDQVTDTKKWLRVLGYVCWGAAGVSLLILLCFFKRIRIAIACIKASARFINDTYSIYTVPIFVGIIFSAFLTWWLYAGLYLYSSGDVKQRHDTPFASVKWNNTIREAVYFWIIGLILVLEFSIGVILYIIGNSCCLWYFASPDMPNSPVLRSAWNCFRYHLGSIAFGATILTLIWIIKILLALFHRMCKNISGQHENCFLNFWFKCAFCCVSCFERFIRFLNMKAYILIALTGQSFCKSAYDGFYLAIRNLLRFGALTSVGALFNFFGKFLIASATAVSGFLIITKVDHFDKDIYSPVIPTLFFFLIGYFIGSYIMGIFGVSSDTILTCFCIDEELNNKKGHSSQHTPEELKDLLKTK